MGVGMKQSREGFPTMEGVTDVSAQFPFFFLIISLNFHLLIAFDFILLILL